MKIGVVLLLCCILFSGGTALWAFTEAVPLVSSISENAFLQIAQNWKDLSPEERAQALENYKRFKKLPPERRQDLENRYHRWMELPNEEKDRIQRNYKRYQKMDSDQKEEFQKKYKTWQSKPR